NRSPPSVHLPNRFASENPPILARLSQMERPSRSDLGNKVPDRVVSGWASGSGPTAGVGIVQTYRPQVNCREPVAVLTGFTGEARMPLCGAHLSVAGGLHHAAAEAAELGCDTVQIFTKNASQWVGKPLTDEDVRAWRKAVRDAKLKYPTAHDSYLINLAAPGDEHFRQSIDAFADELTRAEAL